MPPKGYPAGVTKRPFTPFQSSSLKSHAISAGDALDARLATSRRAELTTAAPVLPQHPIYRPLLRDASTGLPLGAGKEPVLDLLQLCPLRDTPKALYEKKAKGKVMRLSNIRDKLTRDSLTSSKKELTSEDPAAQLISYRRNDQKSRKYVTISNKEAKMRGLYEPDIHLIYKDYIPLYDLWTQYINDILPPFLPESQAAIRLIRADLHGALISVERSTCPSYINHSGIMIQETYETFRLISEDNCLRTLIKRQSVFSVNVHGIKYHLYGKFLVHRTAERTKMKLKPKVTLSLAC
ncbi:hypothetical protein IE077_001491 [Cardiosporidium cionae]|uniref:Uncharacterized protein n=1 Tax=Cardiosporidium cionae TaxID=476202 RepID=A0ABQ7JD17_9APIC|nr:hypothetical protein IE077_001491 [Cardiosporidium cionae]|eukprot:KAF8821838.1 hypothetical protein IE077_001491 [Cardiosporidium cionae]